MECWRGVSAQPSGSVERRFQDQQLRDQLQDLDRQQQRDGQERLIPQRGQPSVVVPMEQSPASNLQILRRLELQGGASLLEADLRVLQQRFLGQPISAALFEELRQAVVIAYDRRRILVVVASPQANANGEVVVPVLEARLGQVVVDTNQAPVRSNWARAPRRSLIRRARSPFRRRRRCRRRSRDHREAPQQGVLYLSRREHRVDESLRSLGR